MLQWTSLFHYSTSMNYSYSINVCVHSGSKNLWLVKWKILGMHEKLIGSHESSIIYYFLIICEAQNVVTCVIAIRRHMDLVRS